MSETQGLTGTKWRPIEIAGKSIGGNTQAFLQFKDAGTVSAHGGCNQMGGSYSADQASIRIGPLMATRKGCAPDIMAIEQAFADAIETTRIYLHNDTQLTLKTAQGATTMRLILVP